ncbi:MAG TPA: DUF134 domain-containing protein [Thermoplasmatales archaeon]|nr:DUF134 domain-containing protein [Thermoplasmatales archaeon]
MLSPGHGRRGRRGRCRHMRWVEFIPPAAYFHPIGLNAPPKVITLSLEELEAVRLVDLEHLTQEEAAIRMGVSRKTLWNDLKSAREKLVKALVNGYIIGIGGGDFAIHPNAVINDIERKTMDVYRLLPGRDCGACGYRSCIECARAIAMNSAPYDACKFIDSEIKERIREIVERR